MSNETATAIERGSSALSRHPLFGCGCCSDPEVYDFDHPDGCPREDGYTDHAYEGDCWKEQGRSDILAADVLKAALEIEDMARELFVADSGQDRAFALGIWRAAPDDQAVKKHWRRIATTARTALLGGAS